jgi:mycothiol synthase
MDGDEQMTNKETHLDSSLNLRPARWADVDAVAKLTYDVCEADGDVTVAITSEELANTWNNEGFNVERDAFVVETQDGHIAGYEEFFHAKDEYHDLHADGYIHPNFKGHGIGKTLLRAVEVRACEEMQLAAPDLRVFIRNTIDNKDEAGHALFKSEGYFPVRYYWRMECDLAQRHRTTPFRQRRTCRRRLAGA